MTQYMTADEIDDDLRQRLIQTARRKVTVTYSELSPEAPRAIWPMLDQVNRYEVAEGRPMLTAVVVTKEARKPGIGFFTQARTLGRFDGNNWDDFWQRELQEVWDYWNDGKDSG